MMLHDSVVASVHRLEGTQDSSEALHGQTIDSMIESKQKKLLTEYAYVFEAPVKPGSRAVDYRVDLIDPTAPPPHPRLYRTLEDELIAIKHTNSDYINKG